MLLSMTGFGAGEVESQGLRVAAEIRAVNNRHLKLQCRLPEGYVALENPIETLVRQHIRRGTVQLNLVLKYTELQDDGELINVPLLMSYYRQLQALQSQIRNTEPIRLETLLPLPGVVNEARPAASGIDEAWPIVQQAIEKALSQLRQMRQAEGAAMERDLEVQCVAIERMAERVAERAPLLVDAYQQRLTDRLNKLLSQHDVRVEPTDVIREVGMFADRTDFAEEVVRLSSHLRQFRAIVREDDPGGTGRKLDFLVQELLRETNTIGSKANDAEVATQVVQMKTCIERIREMVQNVE